VIVVAASGNYWPTVVYPARFPETLAAANCDWRLREWRWASAGEAVDVLVPGVAVQRAGFQRGEADDVLTAIVSPEQGQHSRRLLQRHRRHLLARHGGRG
jgi:hypothetical protein